MRLRRHLRKTIAFATISSLILAPMSRSWAGDLQTEVDSMFNNLGAIGNYTAPGAFRGQTYNTYTGIPAPGSDEILAMLRGNLRGALGEYKYSNIVNTLHYFRYPENTGPAWDNPKHLTVVIETEYERKEGPTWTVVYADRLRVHLYRDAIDAPWKDRMVTEELESMRGARKEYSAAEMKALPLLGG